MNQPGSADARAERPAGLSVPAATVARLPLYLRALVEAQAEHTATLSSELLAERTGVSAAQVRKDLSHLGSFGTRGVGYDVAFLIRQMSGQLGLDQDRRVAIVGVGNLGQALARYHGFPARGFRITAAFDADPAKVGLSIGETQVRPVADLVQVVRDQQVAIGIITTPPRVAQEIADHLVAAGVSSILNFAPTVIRAPAHVFVRKVDLAVELQILSFYEQRSGLGGAISAVDALGA
ncbi:MAG: redox-sensing transcriptional repressor Rex [Acidimicrobiales bacterium]